MKITLYTINDCQFSKQEKEYLKSHNLPFEEKNLEANREFLTEMLAVSNNFAGTPVTKIEKDDGQITVLKGFTKEEFDTAFGIAAAPTQPATQPVAPPPPPPVEAHATVTPPPPPEPKPEPVQPPPPPEPTPPPQPAPEPQPLPPIDLPKPPEPPPITPTPEPVQSPPAPSNPVKDTQTNDALNNLLSQLNTPAPTQSAPTIQAIPESPAQPTVSESQTTPQPTASQPVPPPQNDPALAAILNDLQNKSSQTPTPQTNV